MKLAPAWPLAALAGSLLLATGCSSTPRTPDNADARRWCEDPSLGPCAEETEHVTHATGAAPVPERAERRSVEREHHERPESHSASHGGPPPVERPPPPRPPPR